MRLLAAQDFQHADVADARCRGDLPQGMSGLLCGGDRGAVFGVGGSAPCGGALHAGERLHLAVLRGDGLLESGDRLGAARVVQRDCDAEFAGFVAERGVFTLLPEAVCIGGHAGNVRYRYGFVKGDV